MTSDREQKNTDIDYKILNLKYTIQAEEMLSAYNTFRAAMELAG